LEGEIVKMDRRSARPGGLLSSTRTVLRMVSRKLLNSIKGGM
jgi:hypothetical protein